MPELGLAEYFSMAEALGIIATLFVILYFSKKQTQSLNEDEWTGWLQLMKNCFKYGTISEHWKLIQSEGWLNPDFENFLNKEVAPKPESKSI
jgi:hypothetical protein